MNDPSLSSHQRNTSDDVYLAALRRFIARVGHSRVPSGFVEDVVGDKVDLGAWVADIRVEYARASLDDRLVVAVEAAAPDWSWDAWEVSFRTHVAALHQFADREGHANVPPFHQETIDGQRLGLGYWVSARHHEHRRHELPADRVAALEAVMGWEWEYSPESLDAETETTALPTSALYPSGLDRLSLRALRLFADREGHADVPESHVEVFDVFSISLGAWVNELHVAYSRDELTPEQVVVLEAVPGWLWAFPPASLDIDAADEADLARWFKNDDDFRAWLDAHAAWKEELLASIVIERPVKEEPAPANEESDSDGEESDSDDEDLEAWLLSRDDGSWARLEAYGSSEHAGSEAETQAMLTELAAFIEREGHADVPYHYWFVDAAGIDRPLESWVRNVRERFKYDALSAELTAALDGIDGWVWPPKLDPWCKVLDDFNHRDHRSWAILHELTPLISPAAKLDDAGTHFGVTRERVRQLRNKAATELYRNSLVAAAADKFARLLDPAIPFDALGAAFVADLTHLEVLASVATYAGPLRPQGRKTSSNSIWIDEMRGDVTNHRWYGTGIRPDDWLSEAVPAGAVVSLESLTAAFAETFPHAHEGAGWLLHTHPDIRVEDDVALGWSGTLLDKSIAVLNRHGSPLTLVELVGRLDPNSTRSLTNALQHENRHGDRIVWTFDEKWALPEWGIAPYMKQHELLTHIVEEHDGRVSQRRLISEAAGRSLFPPASLKMALSQVTSLVVEDGVVRFRQAGEKLRVPDPWTHIDVFRRLDDDTPLGCWSTIITVNYDELYRASGQLPQALAAPLGMDDGEPCTIDCNGTDVSSGFNSFFLMLQSSRGWRDTLKALGAEDDDQVIFTVLGPRKASVRLVTPTDEPTSAVARIRSLIGGSGFDNLLGDVAYAVGVTDELGSDPSVEALEERLNERVSHTREEARILNAAMLDLFPELNLN